MICGVSLSESVINCGNNATTKTSALGFNKGKRPLCKSCLDWSERRSHLAGHLGQWVLNNALKRGWAKQDLDSRAIQFTTQGLKKFKKQYEF